MCSKIHKIFVSSIIITILLIIFEGYILSFFESRDNVKTPIILWWTPFGTYNEMRICGNYKCFFTQNRSAESDPRLKAILFYGSAFRINDLPKDKPENLSWGLMHEESPRNNPILLHNEALNLFNFSSTFSRFSNIPLTLLDLTSLNELRGTRFYIPTEKKNKIIKEEKLAPLLYIQTDCNTANNRDLYVKELMKHIDVDSYGVCLNNRQFPEKLRGNRFETMKEPEFLSFVARYKFTIAFENAICHDYITEKLWRALIVGSVPIYYGSPSFKDWLPHNKSALSILDYSGPKELATHLHQLLNNDTAYEEHLPHKLLNKNIRVVNSNLLKELNKRSTKSNVDFGDYVYQFECYVCEQVANNFIRSEKHIVTKEHYDCPLPVNPISLRVDNENIWSNVWKIEKCGAKLLSHYVLNNISTSEYLFNKKKMELYDNNNCENVA